jgi:hypothetical protein
LLALVLNLDAGPGGQPDAGSSAVLAAVAQLALDRHHATAAHDGAEHCPSGTSCGSAAVLPDATAFRFGKQTRMLARSDLLAHQRISRPSLHPPTSAVDG